ncbi:hypothetical protein [Taklimakanibacter lacteus]|uniref:hypothetical protein n=1 Tax=Taklimakanibacter lacteus TaxID=2268456 RepID=UPI0013C4845A
MMAALAPDIEAHIVTAHTPTPQSFWSRAAQRPTLIFSPTRVQFGPEIRGTRLVSIPLAKLQEIKLVHKAGYAVPQTTLLTRETTLDERLWGPFTVLKPNVGSLGRGVRLVRTRHVHWIDPKSWPEDDIRHGKELVAQQYVHTGDYISFYRVLMVLGEVVYSAVSIAKWRLSLPDPRAMDVVDMPIAPNAGEREVKLNYDEEIITLAQGLSRKYPAIPVMPVDIIRHQESGQLFVMEINSHGWSWHLSSPFGQKQQATNGLDYYKQFNGLERIAKALVEKTREMAT